MGNVVCVRKESRDVVWLLACVWRPKGIRQRTNEERFPQGLGEEDVRYCWAGYKLEIGEGYV
jgi:hypothetical protein